MNRCSQHGISLIEILVVLAIGTILIAGLHGVSSQTAMTSTVMAERNDLERQAQNAMQRMIEMVRRSKRLLLPLAENPATAYSESTRSLLVVTLGPSVDRDNDGVADADNDSDGRVDEDPGADNNKLSLLQQEGIAGLDDDNDGSTDEGSSNDNDDEDGTADEDPINGIDDDNDGSIDEDAGADRNNDGSAGVAAKDDDDDGMIDEGSASDDDEDGSSDEDRYDPVIYTVDNGVLKEKLELNILSGTNNLADHVTNLTVLRRTRATGDRATLVDLSLTLTGDSGQQVTLTSTVRVGGP